MERAIPLPEIVKVLSEDVELVRDIRTFVDYLGITLTNVIPFIHLFELGQRGPVDLMREVLEEWIKIQGEAATLVSLGRVLREAEFVACAENLEKLEEKYPGCTNIQQSANSAENDSPLYPLSTGSSSNVINYGLTDVVLNFMGRDKELLKLETYFNSPESCRMVILSGLGGIGKTELAKKFTLDISESQIAKSWLAGESSQTLLHSATQFCHHLRISATNSDGQPLGIHDMLQNILAKIKSAIKYSRWLLVIDNVDEIHEEFETALETLLSFGSFVFLLVTTRRRDIPTGEFLEVTELKLQDSFKFIKNSLKDKSSEEVILDLCQQLGNFPLALSQAVAYIKQQQRQSLTGPAYGVENYLDELAKKETLGLDKDQEYGQYSKATLKVWELTLDKIQISHGTEGWTALNLLNIMAFIIPDNIRIPTLHKLFKRFYTVEEFDLSHIHSCLTILLQYSLIYSYNSVISIHRLVQLSLREKMTSESNQVQSADVPLLKSFWVSFSPQEWNSDEMANILKIWKHSSTRPSLHEQISRKSRYVSKQVYDLGMVKESYDFATDCCKFLLDLKGPENKEYLLMEYRLAAAMRDKGDYESSLQKFTFVYGKLKELFGEDDPNTLNAGHWIARVLNVMKRYEESLEWGQKILQSKIRIYGENNKSTLATKHNVAIVLRGLGEGEEALKMYNEILEWQEIHLGKEHQATLITRENIGIYFCKVGKLSEALGIFQDVLVLKGRLLGVGHPNTLNVKGWLADSLGKMGEIDKALEIWEEVAIAREKIMGPDHPQTVIARNKITFFKKISK